MSPRNRPLPTAKTHRSRTPRESRTPTPSPERLRLSNPELWRRAGLTVIACAAMARCYWPGEARDEFSTGAGLLWVALVFLGLLLGLAAPLIDGTFRTRAGWVDLAVILFFTLIGVSSAHAASGRVAHNLTWDWLGVGLAYLGFRWLPREESEGRALLTMLLATAFALAAYAAFQVTVVYPEVAREYRKDPEAALRAAGVSNDPASRRQFEDRLLGSKEPTSTFALTNSVAGFLLPPTLVAAALILAARNSPNTIRPALTLLPVLLGLLTILLLTKSRGGYVGALLGLFMIGLWPRAQGARLKTLLGIVGLLAVVALLAAAAWRLGQLDRLVLAESFKSLRYRWEYVVGTWRLILQEPGVFWSGLGPGNFAAPYLKYKLIESSESISDPHNIFLEVWATAGLPALVALLATLGLGFAALFAPSRGSEQADSDSMPSGNAATTSPSLARILMAGVGGLILAMLLRPDLSPFAQSINPFEGDFSRWVVLGFGWALAAALCRPAVFAAPNTTLRAALAAGLLALLVNLLVSGGIGFAPVALMFWLCFALALNLRCDLPCGTLRTSRWGRELIFALALVWSALVGLYAGMLLPHANASRLMKQADQALSQARRAGFGAPGAPQRNYARAEPYFRAAGSSLLQATRADHLAAQPWLRYALTELENWQAQGAPTDFSHLVWHRIHDMLKQALAPPRDPHNLPVLLTGLDISRRLLQYPGWPAAERKRILGDRLGLARQAAALHPTNARTHADLAEAAWAAGQDAEAQAAARRALELDRLTPHLDKKLTRAARRALEDRLAAIDAD